MSYFWWPVIFLFGAAIGSFILVIAERFNTGLPFLKGRSVCFACNTKLSKKDLFPIFSFLFLRGHCRYCGAKIPKAALFVEILMGALSVASVFKIGSLGNNFQFLIFNFQIIFNFLILNSIFAVILLISVYDLKHFIIPDSFLIFLFGFCFLFLSIFQSFNLSILASHLVSLTSGLVLALPFFLLFLFSRGAWFGFGDVKYIAVLGFWLGLPIGLSAVILAFWIGAVFAIFGLTIKKISPHFRLPLLPENLTIKSEVPFGPFLSLGAILSFLLGLDLFNLSIFLNVF